MFNALKRIDMKIFIEKTRLVSHPLEFVGNACPLVWLILTRVFDQ